MFFVEEIAKEKFYYIYMFKKDAATADVASSRRALPEMPMQCGHHVNAEKEYRRNSSSWRSEQ